MKKIIILLIALMVVIVGFLSGCNELINDSGEEQSKTLPDGTKVTGDIGQIQINEYNFTKLRLAKWSRGHGGWRLGYDGVFYPTYGEPGYVSMIAGESEVPWDLNISNIDDDLDKKREIYLAYIHSNEEDWLIIQEDNLPVEPFGGFLEGKYGPPYGNFEYNYNVQIVWDFHLDDNMIWDIIVTVENIGDIFLEWPTVVVHFYNKNGAWLASEEYQDNNIPVGYTWDFKIRYDGEFSNDISYVSFEVDANSYDL